MDKLPWLGASVTRKEDDRLLRGSGRFLDDVEDTRTLHLAIGRCPYPHARIRRIDATRALELSGVEAVLMGEEVVARTEPITVLRPFPGSAPTVFHGMAHEVARYEGEPVVAVAAVDRYVAEDALELIDVDYEPLPHVVTVEDALRPGAPQLHATVPSNVVVESTVRAGEPERRLADAAVTVDGTLPDQPGERGAHRDARRDRALGGGHEHARALGLDADAASRAGPARPLPAHGRDRRARHRPGRRRRLRAQDRRLPGGHHRRPARHRHAAPGEVDRGPHGVLPRRRARARGRAHADAGRRPRRHAPRAARPVPDRPRRLPRAARAAAPDQHHARRALSPPRRPDPPARRADQQGADGRLPRLRAGGVELRPRGARRSAGAPPRSGSRRLPPPQPAAARRAAVRRTPSGATYDSGDYARGLDLALSRVGYETFRARQTAWRHQGRHVGVGMSCYVEFTGYPSSAFLGRPARASAPTRA